jgi:hypothetical protein
MAVKYFGNAGSQIEQLKSATRMTDCSGTQLNILNACQMHKIIEFLCSVRLSNCRVPFEPLTEQNYSPPL